jgi:hypothetical protein
LGVQEDHPLVATEAQVVRLPLLQVGLTSLEPQVVEEAAAL